jgi:hypothetical protein
MKKSNVIKKMVLTMSSQVEFINLDYSLSKNLKGGEYAICATQIAE